MGPEEVACKNCVYWGQRDNGNGYCHRFPPSEVNHPTIVDSFIWDWPITPADALCGEFKLNV